MVKKKVEELELNNKEKKESSKLVKSLKIKSITLSHLRKAYDLIRKNPEKSYNYKVNSMKEVLNFINEQIISSNIKSQLLEQTIYGALDYREKVPAEKLQEYDELLEEIAVKANLIQPKIPEGSIIKYRRKNGEYK